MNNNLKRILFVTIIFTCLYSFICIAEAGEIKKRIAVLPFRVNNISVDGISEHDAGNVIAKMLTNSLIKTRLFSVVEHTDVLKALKDLGLEDTPVDEVVQKKVAAKLGVEAIIVGWINRFEMSYGGGSLGHYGYGFDVDSTSGNVELEADLVDSSTSVVLGHLKGDGSDSEAKVGVHYDWYGVDLGSSAFQDSVLGHAAQEAVGNVCEELQEEADKIKDPPAGNVMSSGELEGLVADVDASNKVTINIGSNDGVKVGSRFSVLRIGKEIKDPATGKVIKVEYNDIGIIVIIEVGDGYSTGSIEKLNSSSKIQTKDIVKLKN